MQPKIIVQLPLKPIISKQGVRQQSGVYLGMQSAFRLEFI